MKLRFLDKNGGKKLRSKEELRLTREFIKWVLAKFLSKRILDTLEIVVRFDSALLEGGSAGLAIWEDNHFKGRVFTIDIDTTVKFLTMLTSLAHELIHVKQWALGEYHQLVRGDEQYYFHEVLYDVKKMNYWDTPWEIEAFGRQTGLLVQWIEAAGYGEEPWAKKNFY